MLSIWLGDEPYLMTEEIKKAYHEVPYPEMNFIKGELDETNYLACYTSPMFADKRVLFLYSSQKNQYLDHLIEDNDAANDVTVILTGDIDRRHSLFKKVEKMNLIREFSHLGVREFNTFCQTRLNGIRISDKVYGYLIRRMAYGKRENCDLYIVNAWLEQISSAPQVTETIIDHIIPEYLEDDVFRLFSFLIAKEGKRYFKLLDRLLEEDPKGCIGILSVLLRNFRIAYKASIADKDTAKELGVPEWQLRNMQNIDLETAKTAMGLIQESVNRIKMGYPQKSEMTGVSCAVMNLLMG